MGDKMVIGLLVGGIMDELSEDFSRGMFAESAHDDIDIIVIPVKYINREMKNIPDLYEYQYNESYQYITSANIDVLVVAADCIGCLTTNENIIRFMDKLKAKNVPILLAASKIEGYPGVTFDNQSGIIEGFKYLVEKLGLKKICMLKTLETNSDINERYETFLRLMKEYDLEITENTVISAGPSYECRADCARLLDVYPDVEAVICSNDYAALGLYHVMKERGLVPGRDIMVMGFDNSVKASIITPTLTTIDSNAKLLGNRLITVTRMLLEGWDLTNMTVPTQFILRDSFGLIMDNENTEEHILDKGYIDEYFERIFYKYNDESRKENFELPILFKSIMNVIIDYIHDEVYNPERVTFLIDKIREFFEKNGLKYTDSDTFVTYVERVKYVALERFESAERKCQAYETFSAILKQIIKQSRAADNEYEDLKNLYQLSLKEMIEDTLDCYEYSEECYLNIILNLAEYGIQNAYIYLFEKPIYHDQDEPCEFPEYMNLKVAMTEGEISIPLEEDQIILMDEIFNNPFITKDKLNMVLMPLYFRESIYGCILYDLTDISYRIGDILANYYSNAVRIIELLKN